MTMQAQQRESGFKTNPDYKITLEPSPRRVRVKFNGETIADSTHAHLLFETRHLPVYYFPRGDVEMDLLAHAVTRAGRRLVLLPREFQPAGETWGHASQSAEMPSEMALVGKPRGQGDFRQWQLSLAEHVLNVFQAPL